MIKLVIYSASWKLFHSVHGVIFSSQYSPMYCQTVVSHELSAHLTWKESTSSCNFRPKFNVGLKSGLVLSVISRIILESISLFITTLLISQAWFAPYLICIFIMLHSDVKTCAFLTSASRVCLSVRLQIHSQEIPNPFQEKINIIF